MRVKILNDVKTIDELLETPLESGKTYEIQNVGKCPVCVADDLTTPPTEDEFGFKILPTKGFNYTKGDLPLYVKGYNSDGMLNIQLEGTND